MTGTASQIEWAEIIRPRVEEEFQRVARAFRSRASSQSATDREDTLAIVAILEEKRLEVMANSRAGYYIREWQELTDQVRRMLAADDRYRAIRVQRADRVARHPGNRQQQPEPDGAASSGAVSTEREVRLHAGAELAGV